MCKFNRFIQKWFDPFQYVPFCVNLDMYCYFSRCIREFHCVLLVCIVLRKLASVCHGVFYFWFVPICAGMLEFVSACSGLFWYVFVFNMSSQSGCVSVCIGPSQLVPIYLGTRMIWSVSTCIGMVLRSLESSSA